MLISLQTSHRAIALTVVLCLGACADMSREERHTAVGAGVGAVAGSVLTGGSPIGTIGGAVIGGVIADQAEKKR